MPLITFQEVSFHYSNPYQPVFLDLSLSIDCLWRTGIIGRNGRGKTTLLKLLSGKLEPVKGNIHNPLRTICLSKLESTPGVSAFEVIKNATIPFSKWEKEMDRLLNEGDQESLQKYGDILELYTEEGGYEIDSSIKREILKIGLREEILHREFDILSGGEKSKCLIVALFLIKNSFILLDEPTNHLDTEGREVLGNYLSGKKGFLLVSHDRRLLDICTDHILSIDKSSYTIQKGNYSTWKENRDRLELFEQRKDEKLRNEIKRLETSSRERKQWANSAEAEKSEKRSGAGMVDKGYLGAKAARISKRAMVIEQRVANQMEEKKSLLRNKEKRRQLKFEDNTVFSLGAIARLDNVSFKFDERWIVKNFSLSIRPGDRIAIIGNNGCGKTTIFRLLCGEITPSEGSVYFPKSLQWEWVLQQSSWQKGTIAEHVSNKGIDETKFRDILAAMGIKGDILNKDICDFSEGEKRKIEIARSFSKPCDLIIWDEPLNSIDIYCREELEESILKYKPTLLFIEHDSYFIKTVATSVIELGRT